MQLTWKWLLHSAVIVCRQMSPASVSLKVRKHSNSMSRSFLLTEIKARSRLDSCGSDGFLSDAQKPLMEEKKENKYKLLMGKEISTVPPTALGSVCRTWTCVCGLS